MIRPVEQLGPVLSGRAQAKVLRSEISQDLANGGHVVIDLDEVIAMSPSFADEVFAKLANEIREERIEFRNISPGIQSLARFVTLGRTREQS